MQMLTRTLPTLPTKVGLLFWAGSGGAPYNLYEPWHSWTEYDQFSGSLNWMGRFVYTYAHQVNPDDAPSSPPGACPCSLWSNATVPGTTSAADNNAVELGVRFRSDEAGYITGLRFYKGSGNTGTHVGNLWTDSGTLLATATFNNESATGWQQVTLPNPVPIQANTTYVASYHTDTGFYAFDSEFFATNGPDAAPLHAPADGRFGATSVYRYGSSGFPSSTYRSSNYWVDVVFDRTA